MLGLNINLKFKFSYMAWMYVNNNERNLGVNFFVATYVILKLKTSNELCLDCYMVPTLLS